MENYVKTRNIILNICNQSGLSSTELCGVLCECLADVRNVMLSNAIADNMALKAQLVKAAEEKKTEDQKAEKKEEK